MGLAERDADGSWLLRYDMKQVLRAMQRAADRQKTLHAHGELVSDRRLTVEVADWQSVPSVEGRVLVHGEEGHSGKNYLLLESTSAKVYYIPYTREMEEIRSRGGLRPNSFVRMRRQSGNGRPGIDILVIGESSFYAIKLDKCAENSEGDRTSESARKDRMKFIPFIPLRIHFEVGHEESVSYVAKYQRLRRISLLFTIEG
jgi:hypothetical protein